MPGAPLHGGQSALAAERRIEPSLKRPGGVRGEVKRFRRFLERLPTAARAQVSDEPRRQVIAEATARPATRPENRQPPKNVPSSER